MLSSATMPASCRVSLAHADKAEPAAAVRSIEFADAEAVPVVSDNGFESVVASPSQRDLAPRGASVLRHVGERFLDHAALSRAGRFWSRPRPTADPQFLTLFLRHGGPSEPTPECHHDFAKVAICCHLTSIVVLLDAPPCAAGEGLGGSNTCCSNECLGSHSGVATGRH
jgi:hypothetical protein